MNDLAIKITHVSKEYRLGMIGGATLRGELQSKFARLRGKEDPNLKIGEKAHEINERFLALDDVSLEIKKGERVGIIGHNGAGKSTLLKLICRVTAPTKGEIYMNGRITSMLEVGTGFHGELSGRDNVYLNGAILGLSKAEIDKRFDKIVEFSEVGQFIDTPVKRYSSGMNVKLGFAVASHLDSEIMIMDEVLAVGDMAFQKKCIEKMRLAAEDEGRTILYVSHNMQTIRQLCDRCIVLEHGKVLFDGNTERAIDLYMPKKNEEAFKENWRFTSKQKADYIRDPMYSIDSFDFCGPGGFDLKEGTDLQFRLQINAKRSTHSLCIRSVLYYEDGTPVGVTTTKEGELYLTKGKNEFYGVYPTMLLAPGRYKFNIVLYEVNGAGGEMHHDVVDDVLLLNVVQNRDVNGLEWQRQWWGSCYLPPLKLHAKS